MVQENHFKTLGLNLNEVMKLSDEEAAAMVESAYDNLVNMAHSSGKENPRYDAWTKAKEHLCDSVARLHHANELGYTEESRNSGPWWMGGLLTIPAAIVYTSGINLSNTTLGLALAFAAIVVAVLTAHFIRIGWGKVLILGPFLMGGIWVTTGISAKAFARDISSWNITPEIAALAVITTLGLIFGLTGQVRARADFEKEYLGWMTVRFFSIALVLIPVVTLLIPTNTNGTRTARPDDGDDGTPSPIELMTTAQTEGDLNLTRNDWRGIQAGLQALGHYTGTIDGLPGPRTRASITTWQRTQRGVATSFLNRAHADTLAALAPIRPPNEPRGPNDPPPVPPPERTPSPTNTRLVITAEPGSRISIDDEEVGFTSDNRILRIDDVTPGGHVLTAEKDGFDTVTNIVEVEGASQAVELRARALPGRLTVTTNVNGAIVAIDGGEARLAPVEDIEVESGTRFVTVSAPGYNPHEQYVDIAADATTTHHATLEEASLDAEIAQLRRLFDSRSYENAAQVADGIARTLVTWQSFGNDVRENLALTLALQGRALYALGNFAESVEPLYNAVRFGERIELPIKHRHGGGGFRQGYCTGFLVYTADEIRFRSTDDPDHGFAVAAQQITRIEAAERQEGYLSRLNTEVENRGNMDFVHPNSRQQRRDPDSALITDIVCRNCNHALAVHEQLLLFLTRSTQ